MKLGIMQPYFFPYLGYFALIQNTDKWIVFDTVQFIRHGWIERNRILKPAEGWQYINVPLQKHSRDTVIKDVRICYTEDWRAKIIRQCECYKKIAPYYMDVIEFLKAAFDVRFTNISELDAHLLSRTCAYLGIKFDYRFYSEMDLKIDPVNGPGDWALCISKAMGATEYINPPGGVCIFNQEAFKEADIKLTFLKVDLIPYIQRKGAFEAGLSILDVMMFNSPAEIKEMLDHYTLI